MSFCPRCQGRMETSGAACPHCGYDFPVTPPRPRISLLILFAQIAAALGCTLLFVGSIVALFEGQLFAGLITGPICFAVLRAVYLVLSRAQDARSPS